MLRLLSALVLGAGLFMTNPPLPAGAADDAGGVPVLLSPFDLARPTGRSAVATETYPAHRQHTHAIGNSKLHCYIGHNLDFSQLDGIALTTPGHDWTKWHSGDWPDIKLQFKATAPKGRQWPIYHLNLKWKNQLMWTTKQQTALETRQDADFGSLYCLTYVLRDRPVVIREYAFIPTAGRADKDWHCFLALPNHPASQDDTHAAFVNGKQKLTLQFTGWNEIAGRYRKSPDAQEIAGWDTLPENSGGVTWNCAVAYSVGAANATPADLDLSPAGLKELRKHALGRSDM